MCALSLMSLNIVDDATHLYKRLTTTTILLQQQTNNRLFSFNYSNHPPFCVYIQSSIFFCFFFVFFFFLNGKVSISFSRLFQMFYFWLNHLKFPATRRPRTYGYYTRLYSIISTYIIDCITFFVQNINIHIYSYNIYGQQEQQLF